MNDHDTLLNSRQVRKSRGDCSDMTLYRHVKAGILPEPIKINGRNYWRESWIKKANSGEQNQAA